MKSIHRPKLIKNEPRVQKKDSSILSVHPDATSIEFLKDEAYINHLASIVESSDDAIISETLDGTITRLTIANIELSRQVQEQQKQVTELTITNNELLFQNEAKEKRVAELTVDIGKLKYSEAQVLDARKELESFSYSVSHDLKAPLRAIKIYSNMVNDGLVNREDAETSRLLNKVILNANKLGLLVDELLKFSRVVGKELFKKNILIDSLVQCICSELKEEVKGRNIEFRINKLLPAFADGVALKQVWLNLISNAIKYTRLKDKAIIEIGSKADGEEITYYIKDNGAGFDMRYAKKLFGVFQRMHSEDEFEGIGIGLALVQRIISKHGGRTWAEGKVDEGAIFCFTLENQQPQL